MNKLRVVLICAAVFCVIVAYDCTAPGDSPSGGGIFTVESGASLKSIGAGLGKEHFIRSTALFATFVTFFGGERHISPGDYSFASKESVVRIAMQIAAGDHEISPVKITVPEGENNGEIAKLLQEKIPNFSADTFLTVAKPFEGYLFPETYFFYPSIHPEQITKIMNEMFLRKTEGLFTDISLGSRTKQDVVVMASLIEREAHGSDDRTVIAGILWKRLDLGMPLQVDATVAYANGKSEGSLQKSDFSINSPYNTYLYKGLPPSPIANPGLDAINAALHPAETPYLYYLHDSHGSIHYAKTYAEHEKNIRLYLRY